MTSTCIKSMCLNFNFCLYFSRVMDFKPRILPFVCGKLSICKDPNKILHSISKAVFRQTKHFTKLHQMLMSMFYCCLVYSCDDVSCSSFMMFANQQYGSSSYEYFCMVMCTECCSTYNSVLRLLPDSDLN